MSSPIPIDRSAKRRRSESTKAAVECPLVAIGASAGGLEACKTLLNSMPSTTGMAFVLIQHLDPHHESMMVELLAERSALIVMQAVDGLRIESEHLYTIPPDSFLAVAYGVLRVSRPSQPHGARSPFDFFLAALAAAYGGKAICVVLSGTGNDGSAGIEAVRAAGGYCIAQDPADAGYSGMPRSAIATGHINEVLPARDIPNALVEHMKNIGDGHFEPPRMSRSDASSTLDEIIALVKKRFDTDFSTYKKGTLQRRVERRMALSNCAVGDMARYLTTLHEAPDELDLLAKDLLIHTTCFFRDAEVFAQLQAAILPDLLHACTEARTIRVWVAGCSTGEEAYTLAIILHEQIAAENLDVRVQIFASDIDGDAVATAREGVYPIIIASDVSDERLSRFFSLEDKVYRIVPEIRATIVFTVHDVLADPPFSRLDMVSCRNLLIYLEPAAQQKLVSLFRFALKPGGLLLLGTAETVGRADTQFEMRSKPERIYQKTDRATGSGFGFSAPEVAGMRASAPQQPQSSKPRQAALAEICRRTVLETYAPASVLINARNECVYHFGPTDDYLRVAPGFANHNVLEMVRQGTSKKLKFALQKVREEKLRLVVDGGRTSKQRRGASFDIAVQIVT